MSPGKRGDILLSITGGLRALTALRLTRDEVLRQWRHKSPPGLIAPARPCPPSPDPHPRGDPLRPSDSAASLAFLLLHSWAPSLAKDFSPGQRQASRLTLQNLASLSFKTSSVADHSKLFFCTPNIKIKTLHPPVTFYLCTDFKCPFEPKIM